MKYIALIYANEETSPKPGSEEFGRLIGEYEAATGQFINDGVLVGSDPLQSVNTATTLRARNGKLAMTDGPFAETKEQLGGYYIFECENLDDALKYAAMIPTVNYGSIEVRPIMTIER
ncbi:MAG: YciI family protein [Emcibacteraceae bacterium]